MKLSFAHPEAFWLLPFVVVMLAVYLIAKRYTRVTVTYAPIWQHLAQVKTPSHWLKRLQRVATILITTLMLGSLIGSLAGPVIEPDGDPPADFVLLIDTSPSMARRDADGKSALELARARALRMLGNLRDADRAWLLYMQDGHAASAGPFSRRELPDAFAALERIELDFTPGTTADYLQALSAMPGGEAHRSQAWTSLMRANREASIDQGFDALLTAQPDPIDQMERSHHLLILSDIDASLERLDWPEPWSASLRTELLGAQGFDAAITSVQMLSTRARITWRGAELSAHWLDGDSARDQLQPAGAEGESYVDLRFPQGRDQIKLTVSSAGRDPIRENNSLVLEGHPSPPLSITLAESGRDLRDHLLVAGWLARLLPEGADLQTTPSARRLDAQVVVTLCEGAIKLGDHTRALICFGAIPEIQASWLPADLPENWNATRDLRREHDFQHPLSAPAYLTGSSETFRLEGTRFPSAAELTNPEGFTPLVASDDPFEMGLIAARKLGQVDLLYVGISKAYDQALQDPLGLPLLLKRWFERLSLPPAESLLPSKVNALGSVIQVPSSTPLIVELESDLLRGEPDRRWIALPEAGSIGFDQTWYPGVYSFKLSETQMNQADPDQRDPLVFARRVYWVTDPAEVPWGPIDALESAWPVTERVAAAEDWQRHLPQKLLLAGLVLLVLEWVLFWLKVLD